MINALTIDVEDYFHVSGFESVVSRSGWHRWPSRVVATTERVLAILAKHRVRGTFFVLGWVAERFPHLVHNIIDEGHEVASHGHWHHLVYKQSPTEFREDLRRSLEVLSEITGQAIRAYRAPSFSITRRSLWALDILAEEGIRIDSSIFPVRHDRYGIPGAWRFVHKLATGSGQLWEFPPAVMRVAGRHLPVSGGGYFRLYPWPLTRYGLRSIQRQHQPFVFYAHPWEFDPDQPRLPVRSRVARFRHYVNLPRTEGRFERLLETFPFGTLSEAIAAQKSRAMGPIPVHQVANGEVEHTEPIQATSLAS